MTVMLEKDTASASALASSGPMALPTIRREGITWHGGVGEEPLTIELTFENPAPHPSESNQARIGIADFGAFLPWRPLTVVSVPPIAPGGRAIVTATVDVRRRMVQQMLLMDRLDAKLAQEATHFVGNLNVHLTHSTPVERHLRRTVGLRAGRENLALFVVGDGEDDSYAFRLEAEQGWKVDLDPAAWDTAIRGGSFMVLASIVPPAKAGDGRVVVWVRRESTEQEVPVEFELATRAVGAQCYRF